MAHRYRITYRAFNRTTRRMGRRHGHASAGSRWGALRAWWRLERQWQHPVVQVLSVELDHSQCPQVQDLWSWGYTCGHAPRGAGQPACTAGEAP